MTHYRSVKVQKKSFSTSLGSSEAGKINKNRHLDKRKGKEKFVNDDKIDTV